MPLPRNRHPRRYSVGGGCRDQTRVGIRLRQQRTSSGCCPPRHPRQAPTREAASVPALIPHSRIGTFAAPRSPRPADRLCQQLADNVATFVRGDRPHHEFTAISRRLQQEAEWLSSVVVTKAPGRQGAWLEFPLPEQRRIIQQRVAAVFIGPSSAPGKFDTDLVQIQIALVSAWVAEACGAPIGPRDRGGGIVGREAGVGSHTEMDPGSPEHAPCLPSEGRERVKRPHRNVL